jgi:drug/metabolite transporter (DMT)-like permease
MNTHSRKPAKQWLVSHGRWNAQPEKFAMNTDYRKPARQWLPIATLAFLALIWGCNWIVNKISLRYAGPFEFAAIRCLAASLVLFIMLPLTGRSLRPPKLGPAMLLGLLQTAGFTGLSNWALVAGGAGHVAVLVYTMPFWVMLFAWPTLHERIVGWQWLAVALALLGLVCFLEPWHLQGTLSSKVLALSCGAVWGMGVIVGKKIQANGQVDLLSLTAWQMLLGSVPLIIVAALAGEPAIEWTPALMWGLLYNIVPATAIGWLLWLYLLKTLKASAVGIGSLLNPIVGVVASAIFLGELPNHVELAGMLLILLALALISYLASKAK